jgi:hypothetical protein
MDYLPRSLTHFGFWPLSFGTVNVTTVNAVTSFIQGRLSIRTLSFIDDIETEILRDIESHQSLLPLTLICRSRRIGIDKIGWVCGAFPFSDILFMADHA